MELRDYQTQAVNDLRAKLRQCAADPDKPNRVVLCAPTGSGKTEMAMDVIRKAQEKGRKAVFVCDLQVLVRQTSARFAAAGIKHGMLMGSETTHGNNDVVVCSAQTLKRRGWPFEPDLVVVDECHDVHAHLYEMMPADAMVIGLTATPFDKRLPKLYGDVVNAETTNRLILGNHLVPLRIQEPDNIINIDKTIRIASNGEWVVRDLMQRVLAVTGDLVGTWEAHALGKPTLAFGISVEHCEAITEAFQNAGHNFETIHYGKESAENKRQIAAFRAGDITGLVSIVMLTKGFDAPAAEVMVDAAPIRKSVARQIQRMGRVMRPYKDKREALLLDHAGNWRAFAPAIMDFYGAGWPELTEAAARKVNMAPALTGRSKPRRILFLDGTLDVVDWEDGKGDGALYKAGDRKWWKEQISAYYNDIALRGANIQYPSWMWKCRYEDLFGVRPRGRFNHQAHNCHPKAKAQLDKMYREYKQAQTDSRPF